MTMGSKHRYRSKVITEDELLEVALAVRAKMLPDRDAVGGDCQPVSEEIVRRLKKRGYADAFAVFGEYVGHPHTWVSVGGWTVDATHDQFAAHVDYDEMDRYLDNPVLIQKGKRP